MAKPITDIMREHRKGFAVDLATELFGDVVRAVDDTNKAGEVTIKIKVEPGEGGGSEKKVSFKVSCKKPIRDIPDAVFFSDTAGNLHRSDPAQTEMALEEVGKRGAAN
jgi:hypothetical protein